MTKLLVVFTAKGTSRIEAEGGTASWALSAKSMRDCEYVVCTRNTDPTKISEFGNQSNVPHGAAFLVGKVCGLEDVIGSDGSARYRVIMSEVADVLIPNFWDGSRIPTRYITEGEAETRGLNLASLNFRPIVRVVTEASKESATKPHLTTSIGISLEEAKSGLALRFGVPVENIDIIIRA